jgi:NAD(P)-dependent dehydrogenase (short-subunit alcohol dehydrogenase family)
MANPVAMITGSARGIGQACAKALANKGFDIVVVDIIDTAETAALVRSIGQQALEVKCNITSAEDRKAAIEKVRSTFGRLDVLVNNAGVAPKVRADILEATEESYDFVMGINLKGPYFLTQLAAAWMVEQKKERPDSFMAIVNMSSVSAYAASVMRGEYCISKAGISMMTKLFAARLANDGVMVFEVRPGIIKTDMTSTVTAKYDKLISEGITPIRKWGYPEDVAAAVATCATGLVPMSTAQVINVDGGFHLQQL